MLRTLKTAVFLPVLLLACGGALAQSEPAVTIGHDEERDAMVIHATVDIEAKPATVWAVITDCDRAPKFVPNMESCRIVERGPKDRWQVRETVLNITLLPRIRSLSRLEFDKDRRISFKKAGGSDMRIAEGEWRVEPLAKGKATRLRYDALALNMAVPHFLVENVAHRDVPALMKNIERDSLEDEGKQ